MKYKCVVLDHDDTAVMSTPELHYPSFCIIMEKMRPQHKGFTLQEFMKRCFDPGFGPFMRDELGFTEQEMHDEYLIWKDYIKDRTPQFYPGFVSMVKELQNNGAYICVVSHSEKSEIVRHYGENGIKLDLVYGWELPTEQRKPYPYPLEQIMEKLHVGSEEVIMVDDLKLGYDMSKACGIDFAAAGWSHDIPEITEYMKQNSDYYFNEVRQLRDFLMNN